MNFANWSRMSPRDRMLAGLSGQMLPTHGMQVSTSRGVKLGIAPLAGLGLMNTNTLKTDAAAPPEMAYAPGADIMQTPTGYSVAPVVKTNLLQTRAGSMLSMPSVNAYQKPQGIDTKNRTTDDDSGSSRNTDNRGDYGGEVEDVHAQNPITTVEDARAQNVAQTVTDAARSAASTGGWPFFGTLPKWVWIAGALGAAWLVFKE